MDIEKAPVVMSLKDANAVGVVGDADSLYSMMKNTDYGYYQQTVLW